MPDDPFSKLTAEDREVIKHWSEYGQRGATPNRRILPSDWPGIQPFVTAKTVKWSIPIAAHQLPLLVKGFLPSESDTAAITNMVDAGLFQAGDVLITHAYMSTSQNQHSHVSEDKWFIYADGPDAEGTITLHMYRSWTGKKALQILIKAEVFDASNYGVSTGLAKITELTWERRVDLSEEENESYAKRTALKVCDWVLSVDLQETERKVRKTPEELSKDFDRIMRGLPTTGPQTVTRSGQNPGRGARAYTKA